MLTKAWINLLHCNKYERSVRDSNLTTVELAVETWLYFGKCRKAHWSICRKARHGRTLLHCSIRILLSGRQGSIHNRELMHFLKGLLGNQVARCIPHSAWIVW